MNGDLRIWIVVGFCVELMGNCVLICIAMVALSRLFVVGLGRYACRRRYASPSARKTLAIIVAYLRSKCMVDGGGVGSDVWVFWRMAGSCCSCCFGGLCGVSSLCVYLAAKVFGFI